MEKLPGVTEKESRSLALDALRGIAILGMILSSRIPFGSLPGWMYHAQNPPPSHQFNPLLPGISWVDLVFPAFLFAMGAAFPFAIKKQLQKGWSRYKIIINIIKRGLSLAVFAIVIEHLRPTVMSSDPDIYTNLTAILGFVLLGLVFTRLPLTFRTRYKYLLRSAGVLGILLILFFIKYPDGSGFSVYRSDIIILVLANVAVSGSIIWLFTQNNILLRIGFLGILIAVRLSAGVDGSWVNYLWNNFQIPWLFKIYYHQYLFIVIPGTIIGDILCRNISSPEKIKTSHSRSLPEAIILILSVVILLSGLYSRMLVPVFLYAIVFCSAGYFYYRRAASIYRELFSYFIYFLITGLIFEAFEGGIQKGRPTLSFYFVSSALSIAILTAFELLLSAKLRLKLLVNNGMNPMLAYAGGTNLISPLVFVFFIDYLFTYFVINPWFGVLKGLIITILLAYIVSFFTRKKIFWRS